jgi:hypothetical protein
VVSRSKRIFVAIKKELSGVELCKDMLVVLPTEHIVRGFLIEATIEKGRIYLWRVVTPLHRRIRHVILNYSDRIFPETREDIYVNKDSYGASVDLIRSLIIEHMSYLQSIRCPEDFLRHVAWMEGNESVHFLLDLALTYARVGRRVSPGISCASSQKRWIKRSGRSPTDLDSRTHLMSISNRRHVRLKIVQSDLRAYWTNGRR